MMFRRLLPFADCRDTPLRWIAIAVALCAAIGSATHARAQSLTQMEHVSIATMGKGGILISAHIGNWEIAGQLLNRLNTTFNILMYENERANLKQYMDGVQKKKNVNIIAIRDGEMGHLIELHNAFSKNELVVMHGDRFRDGVQTLEAKFLGKTAKFPAGPFIMAAKFGVPLSVVIAVKETDTHYHFFASDPIMVKKARTPGQTQAAVQELLQKYLEEVEHMVLRYPEQWFNYYAFWKEQESTE